jgi:hypothetical protein
MLIFGDADSVAPSHAAEFFGLLGGGQNDPGPAGPLPSPMRLAILPGRRHHDVIDSPLLSRLLLEFTA